MSNQAFVEKVDDMARIIRGKARRPSGAEKRGAEMSDRVTVFLECPKCGESAQIRTEYVTIAPGVEIRCSECGTIWEIEGLIELKLEESK